MNATEPLPVPLTRAEMYRLVDVLRDAGEITLAKAIKDRHDAAWAAQIARETKARP